MKIKNNPRLQNADPGAAGGGDAAAGAGAGAAAGDSAADGVGLGADAGAAAAGASLLAKAGVVPPTDWMPEKFRVMKGENDLDIAESAKKMAESYAAMEKRVGTGDLPPKSADEYAVTVPDELKDAFNADDENFKAFKADALAAGMTQKQFDMTMGKYFAAAQRLTAGAAAATVEQAEAELKSTWKTEAEFKTQMGHAFKAFSAFADPADVGKMDEIGNNPIVLRMLANIGKELGEAKGITPAASTGAAEDIKPLLTSEAASNPKHPEHKATRARIDAFYAKQYGTEPIRA